MFAPIEEIIAAARRGEMVIMTDDEDRENEGDLILPAEEATPEKIGFMLRHTSGILCLSVTGERLDELKLPMMVAENTDVRRTAFTVALIPHTLQMTTLGLREPGDTVNLETDVIAKYVERLLEERG